MIPKFLCFLQLRNKIINTFSKKMTIELISFAGSTYTLSLVAVFKELGLSYKVSPPAKYTDIKAPEFLATKNPL